MSARLIKFSKLLMVITSMGLITSCTTIMIPPGQAKKATGSKSAKPHAPGQQKKATGSKSAKPYAPGQQKKKKK